MLQIIITEKLSLSYCTLKQIFDASSTRCIEKEKKGNSVSPVLP